MIWSVVSIVGLALGLTYLRLAGKKRHATTRRKYIRRGLTQGDPDPAAPAPHLLWGRQLIVPDPGHACRHAQELNGSYFGQGKAPHLPLPDCDSSRCTCWFKVVGDNRSKEERRLDLERRERPRVDKPADRRSGRERRTRP